MEEEDELLWRVDENDFPLEEGSQLRGDSVALRSFRVVNAFLVRSDGRVWIPRRTVTKRLFPGALDLSVGGHVTFGESYNEAFLRESHEELGLKLDNITWRKLAKLSPYEHPLSAWMELYEIRFEEIPPYNPADFSESYWLSQEEFLTRVAAGDAVKGDLVYLVNWYFENVWRRQFPADERGDCVIQG